MDRNSTPLLRRLHPELFRDEVPRAEQSRSGARQPEWIARMRQGQLKAKELGR
jgi:hypothetical protein